MRRKIVAGNWKMNLSKEEALTLNNEISAKIHAQHKECEVYQFVPSIYLDSVIQQNNSISIGAQNGHPQIKGAYTGEISMQQIKNIGAKAVLIGHSERRELFNESNSFLKEKVNAALQEKLTVFFCCGETLTEREAQQQEQKITKQLTDSLFHLSEEEMQNVVIAYEPIWAIGTGKTATSEQANAMLQFIRNTLKEKYSEKTAQNTSILYGGSCNPSNAKELFSQSDIDGGLIGGASLQSEDFLAIIHSFHS